MKRHMIRQFGSLTVLSLVSTQLLAAPALAAAETQDLIKLEHQDPLVPPLVKIRRISVIGTQYQDAVKLVMQAAIGDELAPELLEKDRQRILGLGYFADVTLRLIPISEGHELVVYVRELPVLKRLRWLKAPTLVSGDALMTPFKSSLNQILNLQDLEQAKQAAESLYRSQGYVLAHLELQEADGELGLLMHEGLVESFEIEGLERSDQNIILREIRLKPGEAFNQQIMEADLTRLRNLGYFDSVSLRPEPGKQDKDHQFRMVVSVKEKQSRDVGLNFSLNNRDGVLGGLHYTDSNFLGNGQYLNLTFQAGLDVLGLFTGQANQSQRSFYGRVDFSDPWLLPGRTSFGASLFSERTPLFYGSALNGVPGLENGLLQTRTGVNLSLGQPLFGDAYSPWRGNVSFGAEQVALMDFSQVPRRELSLSKRFSATDVFFNLGGSLSYDTRNYALNPTKGIYGSLSAQPVWGDGSYLRVMGNLSTYIPVIPEALTLAFGLQGGAYLGQQPLYEQFFGTGYSTIRGWQENGSLFGNKYLIGSVEARFPIFQPVSGVLFTDIGNFFMDERSRMSNGFGTLTGNALPFKYGVGAGLRIETPLGLMRLDYGVRDFSSWGWNSLLEAGQLHFSIGHKF